MIPRFSCVTQGRGEVLVSSTSDLLRVGWCSLVCAESLWMIKLMVVSFCLVGSRSYSGQ